MSSAATVSIKGISIGKPSELVIYTHLGAQTVESDVAEGLRQVHNEKRHDPSSVFSHVFVAMAKGSGDSIYAHNGPIDGVETDGYRHVAIDCTDTSVRTSSIYHEGQRHYQSFEDYCNIHKNSFEPVNGRGAGAIFYIRSTDQYMFFLRDDKASIPFRNMVDIIGGHLEEVDEDALAAAMREFAEELDDLDTGQPFEPSNLVLFRQYVDDRKVQQNIFGCVLETVPNLRLNEGQRLVFLNRAELATTDFAFDYNEVVRQYAKSVK